MKMFGLVYSETVERVGAGVRAPRKITTIFVLQRVKRSLRIFSRAFFQDQIDIVGFGPPDAEVCLVLSDKSAPDRISTRNPALHDWTLHKMRSESLIKIY